MDRTPYDPDRADALYEEHPFAAPPPDAAQRAAEPRDPEPSEPQGEAPSGDDTPSVDYAAQLEQERQRREAAERRAQEAEAFQANLRRMAEQHQEQALEQQWATFQQQIPDLSPEEIARRNNEFRAAFQARERRWREQAEQVTHRDTVEAFKREFVAPKYGLTPEELKRLDRYNFLHDPNQYELLAQDIVAERSRYQTLEQRMAAVERDREAEQHVAAGIHRVGGSGGGPALRDAPKPGDPGFADYVYDSTPWTRR